MSNNSLEEALKNSAKYKERTHETHLLHTTELERLRKLYDVPANANPDQPPLVVLIGHSMLKCFKTTGRKIDSKTSRRSSTFNAGVGGDKIENVLYRLKEGLLSSLASLPVKLWVVHVGTNNLRPKGPLRPNDIENYRLLLRALRSISAPDTQALVVGIFRRKDREDSCVRDSNVAVKALVEEMSQVNGSGRMHFVEEPDELTAESLVDHVHLDEEGYRIWDRVLSEKIEQIVG